MCAARQPLGKWTTGPRGKLQPVIARFSEGIAPDSVGATGYEGCYWMDNNIAEEIGVVISVNSAGWGPLGTEHESAELLPTPAPVFLEAVLAPDLMVAKAR